MGVPRVIFSAKVLATAMLIVAGTMFWAVALSAAEGLTLPPAEYKPLPEGTKVHYDTWNFIVTKSDGFNVVHKINGLEYVATYGVFGKEGTSVYTCTTCISYWNVFSNELSDENRAVLEKFWPLKVGKKAE